MTKPLYVLQKSICLFIILFSVAAGSVFAQDAESPATEQPAAGAEGIPTSAEAIANGAEIFKGNCAQCHAVHSQVVGPALANVYERQDVEWLVNFIKYPQKVIDSGDEYAKGLYDKYQQYMPNHDFLSDDEIKNILGYIQSETIKGPEVATASAGAEGGSGGAVAAAPINTSLLMAIVIGLLILLILVLAIMVLLVSVLSKYIKKEKELSGEDQEYLEQRFDLGKIIRSPAFIGIVAFIFLNVVAKTTVDGLFSIGVQQGYAPEQPIPFSHKLHAGFYEIDCKYCHTGVEKSKNANIPSANICMNCHNSIKTTSPEIQKIYTAIENDEPIQWVRIHNLPDLAYFNHSQHVNVGGLECENCHGEIKEMEVVQQHSLLTMGWCIDCHRKTEIKSKDNSYYDKLVKMHEGASKEPLRVEDIGGLECAKCHY
ncbi:c-type cytochrome [Flammeovirgaceae bacterium SG7u.111]|nr:c-type cytochrome [Flammeovirgaceae bacterium SG7u.132]WPO36670.1 c-type cytochrome [Flammeovirgaceae bacterium SG7u.111]